MFAQNDNLVEIEDAKFLLRNLRRDVLYDVRGHDSRSTTNRARSLETFHLIHYVALRHVRARSWKRVTELPDFLLESAYFQVYTVPKDPQFTHVDFIWGIRAREVVWNRILKNMINVDHVENAASFF